MKKYFAMMVAVLFLFGVVGASLAQQAAPSGKQDAPAAPIDGKKTEKSEEAPGRDAREEEGGGSPRDR